ncbi:MAG: bifunctional phosphoglucose/phosphomannose isomerase [Saprospiraceae bacterium]|nr:bifunctional phosphoglucose/phosphomannose isomerase [Saprospiraceae bacterium]
MIKRFPAQLAEAMEIGENSVIRKAENSPTLVYVTGMGGSGIGADFIASFIRNECSIPYLINKTYQAPAYINSNSIVIASSYSGNTEETYQNVQECISKGARVICIASGGKIIHLAKERNLDYIKLPDNWTSPRACLGYSLVAQLYILLHLGLINGQFRDQLKKAIDMLQLETTQIQEKAQHLANSLFKKTTIIYSTDRIEPVAVRFRQQINENAKRLCWHHIIPEMNHNELVGWREKRDDFAVIFLRNKDDFNRNDQRIELTKEIVGHFAGSLIDVYSKGDSFIEKSLYLVHLLDYTSLYLADLNTVDPVEVKVIDYLKTELGKDS